MALRKYKKRNHKNIYFGTHHVPHLLRTFFLFILFTVGDEWLPKYGFHHVDSIG